MDEGRLPHYFVLRTAPISAAAQTSSSQTPEYVLSSRYEMIDQLRLCFVSIVPSHLAAGLLHGVTQYGVSSLVLMDG